MTGFDAAAPCLDAISLCLPHDFADDHAMLQQDVVVYKALYAGVATEGPGGRFERSV